MALIRAHIIASRPAAVCLRNKAPTLMPGLPFKGDSPPVFLPAASLADLLQPAGIPGPADLSAKRRPRKATFEPARAHLSLADRIEARFFRQIRSRRQHDGTATSFSYYTIDRFQE